jgi:polysaccharide export outer membrane protein
MTDQAKTSFRPGRMSAVVALAVLGSLASAGCVATRTDTLPRGQAAYATIPSKALGVDAGAIQPGDRLFIRVLGEPDITSDQYWVDGSGKVQVPLAGEFDVSGKTTSSLRAEITNRLGSRFIRDPQVAVSIVDHSKSSVTVEGEVQHAGRFEASPGLTLLGSLALAQSTTRDARLDEVVVFREMEGSAWPPVLISARSVRARPPIRRSSPAMWWWWGALRSRAPGTTCCRLRPCSTSFITSA